MKSRMGEGGVNTYAFLGSILDLWLFANHIQHTVFEGFFVLAQPVLLPGEVHDAAVKFVALHARLEEVDAKAVVWLLFKFQLAAVLHELAELNWMASAQLLQRRLNLLLLDVVVLLILGATGQTLPGKRTLEQIQEDVADGF